MRYFIFFFTAFCFSCDNQTSNQENDSTSNETIEIEPFELWDDKLTMNNNTRVRINNKQNDFTDIIINAQNGNIASFFSTDFTCGEGPIYNLIGSIPQRGLVFIDRSYSCEGGETCIMVSLQDGSYRELTKGNIWKMDQFSVSPDNTWLLISACDCSMGYVCGMEILDLGAKNVMLPSTAYFSSDLCPCRNLSWNDNSSFYGETAIYEGDYATDCLFRSVQFQHTNAGWASNYLQ